MAGKIVQWLGDIADLAANYIGPQREIRVDTTNWNLRVHDGSTLGGHAILNEEQMDARYQPASGEISGITGFGPTDRGWLVRKGDGVYVLRTINGNPNAEIGIDIPDGFAGSPTITLGNTFVTPKTFTAGAGGTWTGSVDVSSGTLTVAAGQIGVAGIDPTGLTAAIKTSGVPIGAMVLWTTVTGAIPTGWAACDGGTYNGIVTPDLRDKFVVGAGNSYTNGQTGGAASVTPTITVAGHALTVTELAAHSHTDSGHTHIDAGHVHEQQFAGFGYSPGGNGGNSGDPGGGNFLATTNGTANIQSATANIQNTGGGATHTHPGSSSTIDNRPPYAAYFWIMHVGP